VRHSRGQVSADQEQAISALQAQVNAQSSLLEQQSMQVEDQSALLRQQIARLEQDRLQAEQQAALLAKRMKQLEEQCGVADDQNALLRAAVARTDAYGTQAKHAEQLELQQEQIRQLEGRVDGLQEAARGNMVRVWGEWQKAREYQEAKLHKRQTQLEGAIMQVGACRHFLPFSVVA
jgi:chromosome segregation ATPase